MAVKKAPKKTAAKKTLNVSKTNVEESVESVTPVNVAVTTEETPKDDASTKVQLTLMKNLVGLENVTTKCELSEEQVVKAVKAAFKAQEFSEKQDNTEKLFDDEPESINLIVSAIKTPEGEPLLFSSTLPNPYLSQESDICLIVKDLVKGWKNDHEPTIHHYKELLSSKNVDCVDEILPLRQLRVEYKPFEARIKLAKRFDTVLVDKRVLKYVPRYLGKHFYQNGKLPISVDLQAKDLTSEFKKAFSTSLMSMTNQGSSSQIQVGFSNQTETEITENITAVYKTLVENFPGTFANVRSLALRFGNQDWSVPIYISCAHQDSVTLPAPRARLEPLEDELTTLEPGYKVAVYPGGKVTVIKDVNYVETVLDKTNLKRKMPKVAKSVEEMAVDDESGDDTDGEAVVDEEAVVDSDDDEEVSLKINEKSKKKAKADESSEDEGDVLEDEYIKELELLEEGEGEGEKEKEQDEEPPAKIKKVNNKQAQSKKVNKQTQAKKSKKPAAKKAVKPNV